jgi:hypothetical protein
VDDAGEIMKVGDSVTLPTYIAIKGRAGVVTEIDGRFARVRKFGRRREYWVEISVLERENARMAEYRTWLRERKSKRR